MRVGGLAKRKVGVVRVSQHRVGHEHHASWVFVADRLRLLFRNVEDLRVHRSLNPMLIHVDWGHDWTQSNCFQHLPSTV